MYSTVYNRDGLTRGIGRYPALEAPGTEPSLQVVGMRPAAWKTPPKEVQPSPVRFPTRSPHPLSHTPFGLLDEETENELLTLSKQNAKDIRDLRDSYEFLYKLFLDISTEAATVGFPTIPNSTSKHAIQRLHKVFDAFQTMLDQFRAALDGDSGDASRRPRRVLEFPEDEREYPSEEEEGEGGGPAARTEKKKKKKKSKKSKGEEPTPEETGLEELRATMKELSDRVCEMEGKTKDCDCNVIKTLQEDISKMQQRVTVSAAQHNELEKRFNTHMAGYDDFITNKVRVIQKDVIQDFITERLVNVDKKYTALSGTIRADLKAVLDDAKEKIGL
eukprot:511026-Hanusia_phi.AAC.2